MEEFDKLSINDEMGKLNDLSIDELKKKILDLKNKKKSLSNEIDEVLKLYN